MRAVKIDAAGYFIEDIPGDPPYTGAAGTAPVPPGTHFRTRWNGSAWVEGEQAATIEQRQKDGAAREHRAWRDAELARADVELRNVEDGNSKAKGTAAAWRAYRNALRDMTDGNADPRLWVRPTAPA